MTWLYIVINFSFWINVEVKNLFDFVKNSDKADVFKRYVRIPRT